MLWLMAVGACVAAWQVSDNPRAAADRVWLMLRVLDVLANDLGDEKAREMLR